MILNNTHTLAIDKRACSIFAMILSISELFSCRFLVSCGVGAHVTVDGSDFMASEVGCPLSDVSPRCELFVIMLEIPLVVVVVNLLNPNEEGSVVAIDDDIECI